MKKLIYLFLALIVVACGDDDSSDRDNGDNGNDNLAIGKSYQGGIIAYIDSTGQHGLIAATADYNGYLSWDDAMSYCADKTVGQYDDWRLPNKDELNQLYEHQTAIGGFTHFVYWSSTEFVNSIAWFQGFRIGYQYYGSKYYTTTVRAVRAF